MARSERESYQRHPFTAILGVDSHLRILRVLARHSGWLASPDLARRSRLSRESVRAALSSLEGLGPVEAAGSMRSRLYRLRGDHALASALVALFEAEEQRFQAILDAVREAGSTQTSMSLFLYGSAARGEDGPGSDLDIGVIAPAETLEDAVTGLREALRAPAEQLGFVPNVVGLHPEDTRRLAAQADPWWITLVRDALVIAGDPPGGTIPP